MKKIKKYVVWFCIASMLLIAGCGSKANTDVEPTKKVDAPAKDIKEETKPTEAVKTEEPGVTSAPETPAVNEPEVTKEPEATKAPEATVTAAATPTAAPTKEAPRPTATPVPAETGEKYTVVIPGDLSLCTTEGELEQYVKDYNLQDAVIDGDRLTITAKMTITEKVEFIKQYRENIKKKVGELLGESDYSDIISFDIADDFSGVTFTTKNSKIDDSGLSIVMVASYIALADAEFNGGKCTSVVKLVNDETKADIYVLDLAEYDGNTEAVKAQVLGKLLADSIGVSIGETESYKGDLFKTPGFDAIKVLLLDEKEKVLLDNEMVTIKIGKPQAGTYEDFVTPLYIKNKTNETLIFELAYTATNKLADRYPDFGELVLAAGDEGSEDIGWYISPFTLDEVDSVEFAVVGNNEIYEQKFYQRFEIDFAPEDQMRTFEYAPVLGDVIVLDNEYLTIIASEMEQGDFYSVVPYYVKNKTAVDLYLNEASTVIDNFMVESLNDISVPAGMCTLGEFSWLTEDLAERGISRPADIEINYQIAILNSHEIISKEKIAIKPLGNEALPFDGYELPDNAKLLVDDDMVKIYAVGFDTPEFFYGFEAKLYIENKTDKDLIFMSNTAELNKVGMDSGFLFCNINAGKRAITSLSFSETEMEDKNIGNVSSMAFKINAVYSDNYFGGNLYEKSFSVEVN